ncbi:MAG: alpha-L-rhamnosidase C-terminal domain-containing protein, partial [Verrucomicrobiia bacterium]
AADDATCNRLRARFPRDLSLAPGSFFCWHAVFTAMVRMGTYDEMTESLGPWHESINLGLDTFVEENSYWRSLCHAWSAHPVLEFLQRVLGIRSTSPGFATIRIQPMPGKLNRAAGRLCTPRGFVEVAWRRVGEKWEMSVDSPVDTPVEIVLPDGSIHQSNGGAWKLEEVSA